MVHLEIVGGERVTMIKTYLYKFLKDVIKRALTLVGKKIGIL